MLDLGRQLEQVLSTLVPAALIGGLALAAHRLVRATLDVDLLVASEDASRLHDRLLAQSYECLRDRIQWVELRRYFEIFDRLDLYRELLEG